MTAALQTPLFVWYLMRGSGLVALLLLTLSVVLGVLGVSRWQSPRWPRLVTGGLHRNLALLTVCFLVVHVGTALVDGWVGLGWTGVVVPFLSRYRPLWVGAGVLAGDLLVTVVVTSLLRRRIGVRAWRFVHWAVWAMWPLAAAHALGAGSDATHGWGLDVCLGCIAAVVGAAGCRLAIAARGTPRPPGPSPVVPREAMAFVPVTGAPPIVRVRSPR